MDLRACEPDFLRVPTGLIREPALQARLGMDEQKLEELADDLRVNGVLVPIHVFRDGDGFEVIAGHRRRLAAGIAGLLTMPCLVYPSREAALERVKFAENHFREDMSPADECYYFSELMEKFCNNDTNQLAALVGKKRDYVEGRLRLYAGDPVVFLAVRDRKITLGVAHALNEVTEKLMRDYFLDRAVREGSTISVVTGWVQQWLSGLGPGGAPADPAPASSGPALAMETNYFRCYCCNRTDDVANMVPVNIHTYCKKAILDPLLHPDAGPAESPDASTDPRRI